MQHKLFGLILTGIIFASPALDVMAGEVELFIPEERAKQILIEEKAARRLVQQEKYDNFKQSAMAMIIHENNINNEVEDVITNGGIVILDGDHEISPEEFVDSTNIEKSKSTIINDSNSIHENAILDTEIVTASIPESHTDIKVHENAVEFSNFIVHENTIKSRYIEEINTAQTPNEEKVWTAASSQATLLFSTSAKERDQATDELINNGRWLNVAKKLLASTDSKIRINGIQLIKTAVMSPKYNSVSTDTKVKKLSSLLITSLNDKNSKVRFIAALVLSKLTGDSFNYNFNSDPISRQESITAWNNHIKITYGS